MSKKIKTSKSKLLLLSFRTVATILIAVQLLSCIPIDVVAATRNSNFQKFRNNFETEASKPLTTEEPLPVNVNVTSSATPAPSAVGAATISDQPSVEELSETWS